MVVYTKPQQMKKEESERLRGERDQIKYIDLGIDRWHVVRIQESKRKARRPISYILYICLCEYVQEISDK